MATAMDLESGLNPGRVVRTLRGEYTGARRNVMGRLYEVGSVASPEDYQHIKTILTKGCPSKLIVDEPKSNKIMMIERAIKRVS